LVVAALTLQCARHRGAPREPGFLDRYATAWLAAPERHPIWIAEAGDEHAGYLQALVLRPLPWPGAAADAASALVVQAFFVRPDHRGVGVGEELLRAAVAWAREAGLARVSMSAGEHTAAMLERLGFSAAPRQMVLEL
jgi:GNAT superfamily N-acetyltransferase